MTLRKITALFAVLALLISAASCGKKAEETAAAQTTARQETQPQTLGSKPAEKTQPEEAEEEEEYEEEEYEEYYFSQEEIFEALFDQVDNSVIRGDSGAQAPDRVIDKSAYPKKYDLREFGVVTPVKNQNPFGTCWAFGSIAACETSILSEMGLTYEEYPLDLSEHHLAWFANMHLKDNTSQNGEGVWHKEEWATLAGGFAYTASSLLSTGTGVTLEEDYPYRGKQGVVEGNQYSDEDDWTLEAKDRFVQYFELEESRILPTTVLFSEEGDYLGLSETAVYDIKDELLAGRGVAVSYRPKDRENDEYCATYCGEPESSNHCCCIVGWDDTFSRDNFLYLTEDGEKVKPEGNGAWIVKNSWGAETESFPNSGDYGILDEEGRTTGFFYLSYYDQSIDNLISFDFLAEESEDDYYMIDQYDYLQSSTPMSTYSEERVLMANEFEAEKDEMLRCISLETGAPGVHVHYEVYRVTDPGTGPESAEFWTSGDEDYRYAGYHRIDLAEPMELMAGEHYLVSFYQETEMDGETVYLVSFHSAEVDKDQDYYVKGIVNPGESWLYCEAYDQWIDWCELVQYLRTMDADTEYDNFSIKGYADAIK